MMAVAQRIEERMRALGLSRAETARRASMPLTTLTSLIDRGSRKSEHLVKIASVLRTTPAYLTGETDDVEAEVMEEFLTSEERNWLDWLRAVAPADRKALAQLARTIATSAPRPTLHDGQQEYRAAG